jgi:O-antigen ligase
MALIILLPAVFSWAYMAWGSVRRALLAVYLPSLLLLPDYYNIRLTHLPAITFADAAILPIAFALLLTEIKYWRPQWMDLWVFVYCFSVVISQGMGTEMANGRWIDFFSAELTFDRRFGTNIADSGMMAFARMMEMIVPYMIGKLLIERAGRDGMVLRRPLVARISMLLALVGYVSIVDFVKGGSLWQAVGSKLFPGQFVDWPAQMRWGFGRIAGPFGHAILAGMIFLMGLIYCLWLRRVDPTWGQRRLVASVPVNLRNIVTFGLALGLLMTQSRGPWLGVLLALVFAGLTRILSVPKAAITFLVLMAVFFTGLYYIGQKYTSVDMNLAKTEDQRSAVYRRQLLTAYAPIVAERKAFGWGITNYPAVPGQKSIDNEYLLLAVTQGFFGLGMFLLIAGSNALRLLRFVAMPLSYEDRLLVFAHLAVLIGLLTTVATVYMGEQVTPMYFLMTGWIAGMHPRPVEGQIAGLPGFRRVIA